MRRRTDLRHTFADRTHATELRVAIIEIVRKFANGRGYYRGQLVAVLRDIEDLQLDNDDVIEIIRSYLWVTGQTGRGQLAGLARALLS